MKLLILHLSDIHISDDESPILARHAQIADAVKNVAYDLTCCVIAVTGDLAFSGSELQYTEVAEFLTAIRDRLNRAWGDAVPIRFVLVPGNHDCDFQAALPARASMLRGASTKDHPSKETIETCTEIQDEFFDLRETLASDGLADAERLYYEYIFEFNAEQVVFRCCNTAWLSRLHEQPKSLAFPAALIPAAPHGAALVVSVFHHPYTWLTPDNARAFRRAVEESSDIILTGHEHDFGERAVTGRRGERNLYIEGSPLLPGEDAVRSEFNTILIDTEKRRQKVSQFAWGAGWYTESLPHSVWEDYQVSQLRNRDRYELSDEHREYLDDPGVPLSHPSKRSLTLSDIFVYPEIRKVTLPPAKPGEALRDDALLNYIVDNGRILITGPEQCGKTSLAKRIFLDLHQKGYVPVLLRGEQIRLYDDDERTYAVVEREYSSQYRAPVLEAYKQLDRRRRVIIIDDTHKVRLSRKALGAAIKHLTRFAGQVVLIADELTQQVSEIVGVGVDGGINFPHFRIQHFGYVRRNELAERWFALDPSVADDEELYARKLVEAKRLMDTAIGHNFVPSYPVFILPVLQAHHHNETVDVRASTYGYFYELLIRRALAAGTSRQDLDVKLGWLAYVAYAAFDRNLGPALAERDLRKMHDEYEAIYLIPVSFAGLVRDLAECSILEVEGDRYSFKYPFIYYYFVASYIKDHLSEQAVQTAVVGLSARIHEELNANILLFLAHLSKDPFIVNEMMRRAATVFHDSPVATLAPEESPFPLLDKALQEVVYEERSAKEARESMLQALDADAEARREKEEQEIVARGNAYLAKVSEAFRTLQILGQVIKNFPGTMEGPVKVRVTRECYDLGLRTLRSIFQTVKDGTDEFVRSFVDTIKLESPDLSTEDLVKRARESIHGLTLFGAYGMVRRIANAVGSPNLMKVYEQVRGGEPSPAVRLVHAALKLDQEQPFPADDVVALGRELDANPMASRILKGLVVSHFHLFNVKFKKKQYVCQKLGIPYKAMQAADARKLLPPADKKE